VTSIGLGKLINNIIKNVSSNERKMLFKRDILFEFVA
jgi:hypothetical protein